MRLWLSYFLVLAAWHGSLLAQESVGILQPTPLPNAVQQSPYPPRPQQSFLNRHGMNCASHFTWFGTGSLWSEMQFHFGSSRTFFGEPCFPKPTRHQTPEPPRY